jgi:hypothetical protein
LITSPSVLNPYKACILNPNYDALTKSFAFSVCSRWACLPADFNGQPYVLTVPNMTQNNIALMPPGTWYLGVRCF